MIISNNSVTEIKQNHVQGKFVTQISFPRDTLLMIEICQFTPLVKLELSQSFGRNLISIW
jgi:hypothetical protein